MKFLALQDLLILLDAEFVDGVPQLQPWDPKRRQGSYIDIVPGVRVHGLRYYGSGTALAVQAYGAALAELPARWHRLQSLRRPCRGGGPTGGQGRRPEHPPVVCAAPHRGLPGAGAFPPALSDRRVDFQPWQPRELLHRRGGVARSAAT